MTLIDNLEFVFSWTIRASFYGTVLVALVLLVQGLFQRRLSPVWRHRLWFLVVLRFLVPVFPASPTSIYNYVPDGQIGSGIREPSQTMIPVKSSGRMESDASFEGLSVARPILNNTPTPVDVAPPVPMSSTMIGWRLAAGIWLCGVVGVALGALRNVIRIRRLLKRAPKVSDERAHIALSDAAVAIGVRRPVDLREASELDGPAVWGMWHPVILVPKGFSDQLTDDELKHVFLHELAHVKHHDFLLSWATIGATAIHWFNPVVWFAAARMRRDRELAADDLALTSCALETGQTYGATVIKVVESLSMPTRMVLPGMLRMGRSPGDLRYRIQMIAKFSRTRRGPTLAVGLAGMMAMLALTDAQSPVTKSQDSLLNVEQGERQVDREHLEKIGQAIGAYRADHGGLPSWLSDLYPDYLQDPSILISPVEQRTGRSKLYGNEDPKLKTSYIYEFNSNPAPGFHVGNARLTMKEWKMRQVRDFGEAVPVVRCLLHEPTLNLAYSGDVFEAELHWERDPRTLALKAKLGNENTAAPRRFRLLKVHVVEDSSEAPVAGATVRGLIHGGTGLKPPVSLTTDELGVVEISIPDGETDLIVGVDHSSYAKAVLGMSAASLQDPQAEMEVRMLPGTTIGGKVVDTEGVPIQGVEIRLTGAPGRNQSLDGIMYYKAQGLLQFQDVSRADGSWSIPHWPQDSLSGSLTAVHAGFIRRRLQIFNSEAVLSKGEAIRQVLSRTQGESFLPGAFQQRAVLVMGRGVALQGVVTDNRGQAIGGALVSKIGGDIKNRYQADPDGRFNFDVSGTEKNSVLLVERVGYAMEAVVVTTDSVSQTIQVVMEPALGLRGRVLDEKGNPVPDAAIYLIRLNGQTGFRRNVHSGPDGRFVWPSAPRYGSYMVSSQDQVRASGEQKFTGNGEEFDVVIKPLIPIKE